MSIFQMSVEEEKGQVLLKVVRVQGVVGIVSVEWRTIDGTAVSQGKEKPDYQVNRQTIICSLFVDICAECFTIYISTIVHWFNIKYGCQIQILVLTAHSEVGFIVGGATLDNDMCGSCVNCYNVCDLL